MKTLRTPSSAGPRAAAFTLMEMLAVMLLILTVLGMGVPAMFAAERRSYVNQAMQSLIEIHNKCQKLQRELAARGDPGIAKIEINFAKSKPEATVSVSSWTSAKTEAWFGRKFPLPIHADEFVSVVMLVPGPDPITNFASVPDDISWTYERQTGFIQGGAALNFQFLAIRGLTDYKVKRPLTIYPQGYSEVP